MVRGRLLKLWREARAVRTPVEGRSDHDPRVPWSLHFDPHHAVEILPEVGHVNAGLRLGGTLAKPDTSQVRDALLNSALERSVLLDNLFNRGK